MDRSRINRALAKAIAYKACGKQQLAARWMAHLLFLMDTMDIADQSIDFSEPEH